ncbi:hypothetical protein HTG_00720 [Natrinema mahii]|nr:hypothetical protein HTG_00720 [Natrinema mahii]
MRLSKGALLVVVAVLVPIVVELRTALSWFGITVSVLETVAVGLAAVVALLAWAVWPQEDETVMDTHRSD